MPVWAIVIIVLGALGIVFGVYVLIRRLGWFVNGFIRGLMSELASQPLSGSESAGPRSLSSLESVLLPQVRRDFPEYNPIVIAKRVAADAKCYYESGAKGASLYAEGVTDTFRRSFAAALPSGVAGAVVVHRVALHAYDSISQDRVITYQAAVQYKDNDGETRQRRLVLKYIAAFTPDPATEVKSPHCPNCGAPMPVVGGKTCSYCGSPLKTPAGLGWMLTDVHEG